MRIGYARVSTIEQDTKLQTDALKKAKCDRIITEKASGPKRRSPGAHACSRYRPEGRRLDCVEA